MNGRGLDAARSPETLAARARRAWLAGWFEPAGRRGGLCALAACGLAGLEWFVRPAGAAPLIGYVLLAVLIVAAPRVERLAAGAALALCMLVGGMALGDWSTRAAAIGGVGLVVLGGPRLAGARAEETDGDPPPDAPEALFRRIYENSQIGIAILDRAHRFERANPRMCAQLGFSEAELAARTLADITYPADWARELAELHPSAFGPAPRPRPATYQIEKRFVRKDCKIIWTNVTGSIVRDEAGRFLFTLITVEDTTERQMAEERLRRREAEFAHALRVTTAGEMATGLAHEINQPLGAITNYAEACLRRVPAGAGDPQMQEDLEQIIAQATRASAIIRGLREFIRRQECRRVPLSLNALVREAVEFVQLEASQAGSVIQLDLAPDAPNVLAERVPLQQVLVNLVRNAADAMADTPAEQRIIRVSTVRTPEGVRCAVSDHGHGLPHEVYERVFRPFFSTKPKGLGVGLSLCRTIVEAHGGRLWLEANQPAGTTFCFALPAAPPEGAAVPTA